ncbi:hypothetical protein U1872_15260 [Sphingomonas sp. RB3P16]|uniref:hypothetical protein n=1 Tax=Parasphingomonas frigoris TaxID=3096163 RepID=UPI002FC5EFFE
MTGPTPDDRLNKLLESFMGHVISLDGVRLAHRHMLAELLARLPNSDFVDELIAGADATEAEPGEMRRMAAYRSELDTLVEEARAIREGQAKA